MKQNSLENVMLQQQSWCEFIYLFNILWGFSSLFLGYGSSHLPDLSLCKLLWLQSNVHWCSFTVSTNLLGEAHDWVHWLWVMELYPLLFINSAIYLLLPLHPFAFSEMKMNFWAKFGITVILHKDKISENMVEIFIWMFITSNGKKSCTQKSCEKHEKPLPFLTQGKCFHSRAGLVCQDKYLGAAFKVVNLFLYGMMMRNHWIPAWGKNLEYRQGSKMDVLDLKSRGRLVSQGKLL